MAYRVSGSKKLALFIIGGLAIILLISQTTSLFSNQGSQPFAEAGAINLSDWNFGKGSSIKLDGEWEFYWDKLLTAEEVDFLQPDLYAEVPSTWNSYTLNGQRLPGQGHGTYRLRVTNIEPGAKMSFQLSTISSAYKIFINDKEIAGIGTVATNLGQSWPEHRPQTVDFSSPATEFDIIIQVANYNHASGGLLYSIIMGSSEDVASYYNSLGNRQLFFAGALIFSALTYFCLYVLRRQSKQYLYLAMLALVLMVLIGTMYPTLVYRMFPELSFHWYIFWSYASVSWTVALFVLLTEEMYPAKFSKQVPRAVVSYTATLSVIYILTPVSFFTGISTLLNLIGLLMLIFVIYLTTLAMSRGVEGSGLYMFGLIVAIFAYVHDTLLVNNYIHSDTGELVYVGIAILFFVQTIVHAIRFTRTYDENILLLDKLHRIDQQKDEFMFNTAHQIRAPLTAITTLADELLDQGEVSAHRDNLSLIKAFSGRAATLVNDNLDYSFLKQDNISLNLASVDLKAVVENVLQVFRLTGKGSQIILGNSIPSDFPHVIADENRLYQILYILVGNALLYARPKKIQVDAILSAGHAAVSIDCRSGFIQSESNPLCSLADGEDENVHSDLSLFITRQLVALHGGTIQVEDAEGQGVAILFTLPVASSRLRPVEVGNKKELESEDSFHIPGSGPHILVADGNVDTLKAIARNLGHSGFAVTAVSSGESAMERVMQDSSIAVVLLDLIIPEKSGFEICREIRKNKSAFELPILVMTVRNVARDIALAFDAGANDYLAKPFEAEELLARIRTLADLKQSVDKAIVSEIAFLQAQIKPHFLYNALSVIAALTVSDPRKARGLVINLSEYLRSSFSFSGAEGMVPLSQEIDLVQAYVAIEKARFGSRLDFQVVADGFMDVNIPRLVLQPLVENAIRHGIYDLPQGGHVLLKVDRKQEQLQFSIVDNGVGMKKEQVDELLSRALGQGIGIANINKRLLRYYGSELKIYSTPDQGTTVTFSIPLQGENMELGGA